jgi:hypothetical protein
VGAGLLAKAACQGPKIPSLDEHSTQH